MKVGNPKLEVRSVTGQLVNWSTGQSGRVIQLTDRPIDRLTTSPFAPAFTMVELTVVISILVILMGIIIVVGPRVLEGGKEARLKVMFQTLQTIADEYKTATKKTINHIDNPNPLVRDTFDWETNPGPNNPANPAEFNASGSDDSNPVYDGQIIPHNSGPRPDKTDNPVIECSIERFVWATMQIPACEELYISSFTEKELTDTDEADPPVDVDNDGNPDNDGDGFLEIRDPWGNKLIYVTLVRDDPTELPIEMREDDFLRQRPQSYFTSAGPDGQWGVWNNNDPAYPLDQPGTQDLTLTAPSGTTLIAADDEGQPYSADNLFSFESGQ